MADRVALTRYLNLLDDLERTARGGHKAGAPAAKVSADYTIPSTLGDWMATAPAIERAMTAWYRQLDAK